MEELGSRLLNGAGKRKREGHDAPGAHLTFIRVLGMRQVVNNHFCRSKDLLALPVTALEHLQDCMIGLGRIVALGNSVMQARVELLADDFVSHDTVLLE